MFVFTQGLKMTVEEITDNSKIPKPRKWPFLLCWHVFEASYQDLLLDFVAVQVLCKANVKMELEV